MVLASRMTTCTFGCAACTARGAGGRASGPSCRSHRGAPRRPPPGPSRPHPVRASSSRWIRRARRHDHDPLGREATFRPIDEGDAELALQVGDVGRDVGLHRVESAGGARTSRGRRQPRGPRAGAGPSWGPSYGVPSVRTMGAIAACRLKDAPRSHTSTNSKRGSPNPARKELEHRGPPFLASFSVERRFPQRRLSRSRLRSPPMPDPKDRRSSRAAAFFDLDRTLLSGGSHGLLGGHAVGRPDHPGAPRRAHGVQALFSRGGRTSWHDAGPPGRHDGAGRSRARSGRGGGRRRAHRHDPPSPTIIEQHKAAGRR